MKARSSFVIAFVSVLLIGFAGTVHAQPLNAVSVTVLDRDSNPVEGCNVELLDQSEMPVNFGTADAQGVAAFAFVEPGTYSFRFSPSFSPECPRCGALEDTTLETVVVNRQSLGYDQNTDSVDIGPFMLDAASHIVAVTVTDQTDAAVPGIDVSIFCDPNAGGGPGTGAGGPPPGLDGEPSFAQGKTDQNGQVKLAATGGTTCFVNAFDPEQNYGEDFTEVEVPAAEGEYPASLQVNGTDSSIVLSLVDSEGNPEVVGQNQFGGLDCASFDPNDPLGGMFFFTPLEPGQSSGTVKVVGDRVYDCNAFIEGKGVQPAHNIAVAPGETKNVNLQVLNKECQILVTFTDEEGNVITEKSNLEVFANTAPKFGPDGTPQEGSVFDWTSDFDGPNGNGVYELEAICDLEYEVSFFSLPSDLQDPNATDDYVSTFAFKTTTPQANKPGEVEFARKRADVTYNVTVLDANGNPAPFAWVDVVGEDNSQVRTRNLGPLDDRPVIVFGSPTNESGVATIKVASKLTYNITAWMPTFDASVLNPAPVQDTPEPGTYDFTLQAQEPDHTLSLSIGGDQTTDWLFCAVWSQNVQAFGDAEGGGVTLNIVSGQSYEGICDGAVGNDYFSTGIFQYTAPEGESTGQLNVNLAPAGSFYPPQSYTFDPDSAQTLTFPDNCSSLTVPAGAFEDNGNVTVTCGTNDDPKPFTDGVNLAQVIDCTVVGSGGEDHQPDKALKLCLCYDESVISDDEISGMAGDNENGNGLAALSGVEIDTENNQVCGNINHFSDYGINRAGSLIGGLDAAENLRAKRKNGCGKRNAENKRRVTWTSVEGATNYRLTYGKISKKTNQVVKTKSKTIRAKNKNKQRFCVPAKKKGNYLVTVSPIDGEERVGGSSSLQFKQKKKKN